MILKNPSEIPPEQRVLLAVILLAVSDACVAPTHRRIPQTVALEAHDFLWGDRLDTYLAYFEIDPHWFRTTLTEVMSNTNEGVINHFNAIQRRTFRLNKRMWETKFKGRGYHHVDFLQDTAQDEESEETA